MKWALLVFFALNATLAIVQWIPLAPVEGAPTLAKAVPGERVKAVALIKASAVEADATGHFTEPVVKEEHIVETKPMHCYAAGPFPKLDKAVAVQAALEQEGFQVATEERRRAVELGYLVYIPPLRSATLARLLEDDLRAKGVGDSVVIKSGEFRNAVAVGVFRENTLAEKRQVEVQSLGFKPQLAHRTGDEIEVWLRVVGEAEKPPVLALNANDSAVIGPIECT